MFENLQTGSCYFIISVVIPACGSLVTNSMSYTVQEGEALGAYGEWVPVDKAAEKAAAASRKASSTVHTASGTSSSGDTVAAGSPEAVEQPALGPVNDSVFPDPEMQVRSACVLGILNLMENSFWLLKNSFSSPLLLFLSCVLPPSPSEACRYLSGCNRENQSSEAFGGEPVWRQCHLYAQPGAGAGRRHFLPLTFSHNCADLECLLP